MLLSYYIFYMWLVTDVSIFKHCWITTGSWKNSFVVLEKSWNFCNRESGNPVSHAPCKNCLGVISCAPNEPRIRWVLVFSVRGCTFCGTCGDNLAYPLRYTQSTVHYSQSSSTCLPLPSVSKLNVSHKMAAVMQPLSLYCSVATVL